MRGFVVVWIGQVVSLLGTAMSGFGLTIWVYELTGSATALSLMGFFFVTPMLIISPLAGALVDRSNRKLMMMISDLASGLATIVILFLYQSSNLQLWQLYITSAFMGLFQAFQWPAFSAAITTMLPKEQYGRANGLMSLAESGSGILAPILAGALLAFIGLGGILVFDIASFVFAILALLIVVVPQPKTTQVGEQSKGSLWKESIFGFHYILKRPSLLGLQIVFLVGNFLATVAFTLAAPLVLSRTGNNEIALGTVNSIGAIGGVLGGVVMSAWGGTKRKVHGVLSGWSLSGLFISMFGLARSAPVWAVTEFASGAMSPWINSSNQAIWQAKVAPDVQGRVFSIRRLIAWFSMPAATLVAGPLADYVMEPAMQPGGALAPVFEPLVGVGPGAGIALIIFFAGLAIILVGLGGYAIRVIRDAEAILPDHDEPPTTQSAD
jgi:MFS family permease